MTSASSGVLEDQITLSSEEQEVQEVIDKLEDFEQLKGSLHNNYGGQEC